MPRKPESRISGIYAIRCLSTNKVYVGSSIDIANRWCTHLCDLKQSRHHNCYLQRAFDKYGKSNFQLEVLELLLPIEEVLRDAELKWINKLNAFNPESGFNLSQDTGRNAPRLIGQEHPHSRLRDEDILLIVQKYSDGCTVSAIAREYGVARTAINSVLFGTGWLHIERKIFVPKTIKKLTDTQALEIKQRLLKGELYSALAKDFGVSPTTIISIMQGKLWQHIRVDTEIKPRNLGKKLTDNDVVEIKQQILDGKTNNELAKLYGVQPSAINHIRRNRYWKHAGSEIDLSSLPKPKKQLTIEQVKEIKQRIINGESNSGIAKDYQVSHGAISAIRTGKRWPNVSIV
ncbi:MAG: GIY-YIG nuclease family protein [Crinalium sp.]